MTPKQKRLDNILSALRELIKEYESENKDPMPSIVIEGREALEAIHYAINKRLEFVEDELLNKSQIRTPEYISDIGEERIILEKIEAEIENQL